MARQALWLICYDIADPRRLGRVARYLEKQGIRLQYSVFVVKAEKTGIDAISSHLAALIDSKHDDIRFYPLASNRRGFFKGKQAIAPDFLPHDKLFNNLRQDMSCTPDVDSMD